MKPSKQTIETVKTVVIAMLVTGILSFVAGVRYQSGVLPVSAQAETVEPSK